MPESALQTNSTVAVKNDTKALPNNSISASVTEITLRADEVPETAEAAHQAANKNFQRLLTLEKHAVGLNGNNPEYQDSLAGLYFIAGEFDLALQYQKNAAELAPERKDIQQRLAVYQHLKKGRVEH